MFESLVGKLKERLTHFRLGDSLDKCIDMGAIVDESQKKSIEEFVDEARKEGAEVSPVLETTVLKDRDTEKKGSVKIPKEWRY